MHVKEQKLLLALAREAIATSLGHPPTGIFDTIRESASPLYAKRRGLFVTLKIPNDRGVFSLRGCIGNIQGMSPLAESVVTLARAAAFDDRRFTPVQREELDRIVIELSVLTKPRPIEAPEEITIGRDGVILEKGYNRSVFLPQVAPEQGWDTQEMLEHLGMKAGLPPNAWKDPGCELQTFQAEVFSEDSV